MKLSNNSTKVLNYFQKDLIVHKPTIKTTEILTDIHNDIYNGYKYVNERMAKEGRLFYKVKLEKISTITQVPFPKTFNQKDFPDEIRNHIKENILNSLTYTYNFLGRNVNIKFITEDANIENNLETYNTYINNILAWLYVANEYANKKCAKDLTIYLYLTSQTKTLPLNKIDILGQPHINSAFTYSCPITGEIIIFREEEWFKVLIHETFHNYGLDFSEMHNSLKKCNEKILSIFQIKSAVNLYEAYTETWAEILNCSFCAFHLIKNKEDHEEFITSTNLLISFEILYSFFQMVKVLDYMGLTYNNLYSGSSTAKSLRETLYKENTSVLSYYVIKTILLSNYQQFLKWCDTNNLSLLQFKKTNSNVDKFCDFIVKKHKTKNFTSNVKKAQEQLHDLDKNKQISSTDKQLLLNNLRMTLCEMK